MYYSVDKDGVKGWVYAQKTYVNRGTVVLYDDQETSCGTIKGSTVIGDFFERDEKAFFEYDGKECKLEDSRYKIGYAFEIPRKYKAATSLGEFNGKEVKKGTEFIGYASIFFGNGQEYTFVKIDGKFGWIETNYKTATYIEEVEDDSLEKEAKKHKKEDKKEEKEEKEDKKTDSKVIVLSCVIAGVGLVLGSLTALILFNRKKKGEQCEKNIKVIIVGNGDKIIKQYPSKNSIISQNDKVFLLTNGNNYIMPNMKSWSRLDAEIYFSLINMKTKFNN